MIQSCFNQSNIRSAEKITNIELIWLDQYVQSEENQRYQPDLQRMFAHCYYFTTILDFQNFFKEQDVQNQKKYFVIVSGSLGKEFMKMADNSQQILSVFIFCANVQYHKTWANQYEKVKTIKDKFENIKNHITSFYRTYSFDNEVYKHAFHFYNNETLIKYINTDFVMKLAFQISDNPEQSKRQGLDDLKYFTKKYINDNYETEGERKKQNDLLNELLIDLDDELPTGTKIIIWYTKDTYIYRMINNTIRSNNLTDIFLIRYLIYMLQTQIENSIENETKQPETLYRGTCISKNEFYLWRKSQQPFFLQGFTSTSMSEDQAKSFIESTFFQLTDENKKTHYKVLIEIKTSQNRPPLGISKYTYFSDEKEYLLQLNTFLEFISTESKDGYQIIRTKISSSVDILNFQNNSQEIQKLKDDISQILDQKNQNERFHFAEMLKRQNKQEELLYFLQSWSGNLIEEAQRDYYIGCYYNDQKNYSKALEYLQKTEDQLNMILEESNLDEESKKILDKSIFTIGQVYFNINNYSKSIEYYIKSLNKRIQNLGDKHIDIAMIFNSLGLAYFNMNNYKQSLEYFQKALDIAHFVRGYAQKANILNNVGLVFLNECKFKEALESFSQSLQIKLSLFGELHESTITTYNNIGSVYFSQSNFKQALEYYEKGLNVSLQLLGEDNIETAISYNNIAGIYDELGKYQEALGYYQKSLNIRIKEFGNKHPETANSYNNIGLVYLNMNKNKDALDYLQQALKITLKHFGEEHSDTATNYNNIGLVLFANGKYTETIEYYQKSLEIRRKLFGENHVDTANSYYNLGAVYFKMNDFEEALKNLKKSLKIREELLGVEHIDLATTYDTMGQVQFHMDNKIMAFEHCQNSLKLRLKIFGEDHIDTAMSFNNMGLLNSDRRKFISAKKDYDKSLMIKKKIYGENHQSVAITQNNQAGYYYASGNNSQKATELIQNSFFTIQELLGNEHPDSQIVRQNFEFLFDKLQ